MTVPKLAIYVAIGYVVSKYLLERKRSTVPIGSSNTTGAPTVLTGGYQSVNDPNYQVNLDDIEME